jgi:DNA-binding transcriptional LysR family regulator
MSKDSDSKVDLNLLVVFDAVMAEGSVKDAAARLRMKSPAVSQALTRLKEAVGAELFIRIGHGLKPTQRAVDMWGGVRTALGLIKKSVAGDGTFNPVNEQRIFNIDLPTGTDSLVTHKLAQRIAGASGLRFLISNNRAINVLNDLRFGESALAFDYRPIIEAGYRCELVTEQDIVMIARKGHPELKKGLTRALYETLPHVAIASVRSMTELPVNERLSEIGMTRNVRYSVPGMISTLRLVNKFDCVVSVPRCTATLCTEWAEIEIYKLPFEIARMTLYMVWHERSDADASHIWLRQTFREICAEL